jgi:solute carrier family 45, member 1/2/4
MHDFMFIPRLLSIVQATVVVGLIGICWAVACWVPFAIIMEVGPILLPYSRPTANFILQFLKELDEESAVPKPNPQTVEEMTRRRRAISSPQTYPDTPNERQPLIRRRSYEEYEAAVEESGPVVPVAGGTVLGIHNLAIVFPQFLVSSTGHLCYLGILLLFI